MKNTPESTYRYVFDPGHSFWTKKKLPCIYSNSLILIYLRALLFLPLIPVGAGVIYVLEKDGIRLHDIVRIKNTSHSGAVIYITPSGVYLVELESGHIGDFSRKDIDKHE